jgi:hypothetical protein
MFVSFVKRSEFIKLRSTDYVLILINNNNNHI